MKTVGFITSPLTSGHAVRGVGFYTKNLLENLKSQSAKFDIKIIEITDHSQLSTVNCQLVHYPFFDLFSPSLKLVQGVKTVVTIHDVIPLEFPDHYPPGIKGWINLQRQKNELDKVSRIITDSQASKLSIQTFLNIPKEKIDVVYLAADPSFKPIKDKKKLSSVKRKYNLPDKFALYVGDVNWNKNIPGLVQACKSANLPLVIIGKQAKEIESMNLDHPELRHLQNVDWSEVFRLGFADSLAEIYNLATVYCQASFAEGFGLPVLEAMACGTPVAVSRTHSLPEIAGDAATYFDPHDISQISKALQTARDLSGVAQAAKFSWEKTARETLAIYTQLV